MNIHRRRYTSELAAPLLVKELTERANRQQTYIVRVAFALLFYGAFAIMAYNEFSISAGSRFGAGAEISRLAINVQLAGIFLFLPAMMCGVITSEKERGTLELITLTDVSSRALIVQKYLGGLAPMITCLLMALPINGVAYAMGGLSQTQVITGSLAIVLTALNVGAFSLMVSAYCRTTLGAFAAAYCLGTIWYFGLSLVCGSGVLLPPGAYFYRPSELKLNLASAIPTLAITASFLFLSHKFLLERANAPRTNQLLKWFQELDRWYQDINKQFGNVQLVKDRGNDLPDEHPIRWREIRAKAMAKIQYLIRLMLPVEVIVIIFVGLANASRHDIAGHHLEMVVFVLWMIVAALLTVQGSSLITGERVSQTLEVLLTTPIPRRAIVAEKAAAVRILSFIALVPLLTVALGNWYLRFYDNFYLIVHALTFLVYFPLIFWFSVAVGLHQKSRYKGVLFAVGLLFSWCALPIVLTSAIVDMHPFPGVEKLRPLTLFSPASVIIANEKWGFEQYFSAYRWPAFTGPSALIYFPIVLNFTFHTALAIVFRSYSLRSAETRLAAR